MLSYSVFSKPRETQNFIEI